MVTKKKNKLLALILSLAVVVSLFAGLGITASAASVPYTGQTAVGEYTISTATQLAELARKVNAGTVYSGSRFTLTTDINLAASDSYTGISTPWVGGTAWTPDMPIESQIKEQLADVLSIESPTERAIMLTLYLMRKQIFLDGNKRVAMLAGNQVMIASGCGIISVPIEHQQTFRSMLIAYYESGNADELSRFLYDNCVDGIDFDYQSDNLRTDNVTGEDERKACGFEYESDNLRTDNITGEDELI